MELKTYFAQDRTGNLIPSANVSIYLTGTTTLASGLTNVSGTPLANPFTADADGKIQFRAPDGIYDMQVSLGTTTGVKVTFQCVDVEQQLSDANSAADRAEAAAESIEVQAASMTANTREQWRRTLANAGLKLVAGSFEEGATVSTASDAVWHQEGGQCYTWGGALPKTVTAESSPISTGGITSEAWSIATGIQTVDLLANNYTGVDIRQCIINRESALEDITRIRIVTWNVATGFQITGWEPNRDFSSSLMKERIRQQLLKLGADFAGLQECWSTPQSPVSQYAYYPYIDSDSHITSIDGNSRRFGTAVVSTRTITAKSAVTFTGVPDPADPSDIRGYTRSVINIGSTPVVIYNTHMSLNPTKRNQDIAQIFAAANAENISHVVLTGDWNTQTDADFNAFLNAGFGMINLYGEFNSNNHGSPWWIDRILYKGFSSVADKGVMAVPYEMSDHRPVFAELVL